MIDMNPTLSVLFIVLPQAVKNHVWAISEKEADRDQEEKQKDKRNNS